MQPDRVPFLRLTPEQVAGEGMARRVHMVGRVWTIAMRIATYNVNGINGRLGNLLGWLEEAAPDIVCLQELKAFDDKFPAAAWQRTVSLVGKARSIARAGAAGAPSA